MAALNVNVTPAAPLLVNHESPNNPLPLMTPSSASTESWMLGPNTTLVTPPGLPLTPGVLSK
jgi:hypothetical protein